MRVQVISVEGEQRFYFGVIVGKDLLLLIVLAPDCFQYVAEDHKFAIFCQHLLYLLQGLLNGEEVQSLSNCDEVILGLLVHLHHSTYRQLNPVLLVGLHKLVGLALSGLDHLRTEIDSLAQGKMGSEGKE